MHTDHPILKYPRTPHLWGSGVQKDDDPPHASDGELARLVRDWVVEEKVDGANAGISFGPGGDLRVQSRGHFLDVDGRPFRERHFNDLKTWARMHEDLFLERLEDRYVVYGEWMGAVHTQFYDALPSLFLEFDVYDRNEGTFLDTAGRDRLLAGTPVPAVPVLSEGPFPDLSTRENMIAPSLYRSDDWRASLAKAVERSDARLDATLAHVVEEDVSEGLYVKGETDGVVRERFKHVRPGFVQAVTSQDSHWHSRPIVRNLCAHGVEFLDPYGVPPRVDRYADAGPVAAGGAP